MKRGGPLKRSPLASSSSLSRTGKLAGVSAKGRARKQAEAKQVSAEGAAFRAAFRGLRCVMCGRTENEAYEQTGFGHEAHHPIRQQVLRRLGREDLRFSTAWATPLCEEPCHRQHTSRKKRVPFELLRSETIAFAAEHGLFETLLKEHPRETA